MQSRCRVFDQIDTVLSIARDHKKSKRFIIEVKCLLPYLSVSVIPNDMFPTLQVVPSHRYPQFNEAIKCTLQRSPISCLNESPWPITNLFMLVSNTWRSSLWWLSFCCKLEWMVQWGMTNWIVVSPSHIYSLDCHLDGSYTCVLPVLELYKASLNNLIAAVFLKNVVFIFVYFCLFIYLLFFLKNVVLIYLKTLPVVLGGVWTNLFQLCKVIMPPPPPSPMAMWVA